MNLVCGLCTSEVPRSRRDNRLFAERSHTLKFEPNTHLLVAELQEVAILGFG